jgi:hypothetical protein
MTDGRKQVDPDNIHGTPKGSKQNIEVKERASRYLNAESDDDATARIAALVLWYSVLVDVLTGFNIVDPFDLPIEDL